MFLAEVITYCLEAFTVKRVLAHVWICRASVNEGRVAAQSIDLDLRLEKGGRSSCDASLGVPEQKPAVVITWDNELPLKVCDLVDRVCMSSDGLDWSVLVGSPSIDVCVAAHWQNLAIVIGEAKDLLVDVVFELLWVNFRQVQSSHLLKSFSLKVNFPDFDCSITWASNDFMLIFCENEVINAHGMDSCMLQNCLIGFRVMDFEGLVLRNSDEMSSIIPGSKSNLWHKTGVYFLDWFF